MNKTGHYSVLKWVLEKCEINKEHVNLMARASQFVDDATAWKMHKVPTKIVKEGVIDLLDEEFFQKRMCYEQSIFEKGYAIDPICTAHKGIQYIEGIRPSAQKKVYQSFHFSPQSSQDSMVIMNSGIILDYLETIIHCYKDVASDYHAIALGIALHTFCDTYTHFDFSGQNKEMNKVEKVEIIHRESNGGYDQAPFPIGHAEVGDLPDEPLTEWRYKKEGEWYHRKNSELFKAAFFQVAEKLSGVDLDEDAFDAMLKKAHEENKFYKELSKNEVDYYFFHQAAYFQRKFMMKRL